MVAEQGSSQTKWHGTDAVTAAAVPGQRWLGCDEHGDDGFDDEDKAIDRSMMKWIYSQILMMCVRRKERGKRGGGR
jgi:hypothetical protein